MKILMRKPETHAGSRPARRSQRVIWDPLVAHANGVYGKRALYFLNGHGAFDVKEEV